MLTQKPAPADGVSHTARPQAARPTWLVRLVDARRPVVVLGLVSAILLPEIALSGRLPSVRVEQLLLPYALLVFWAERRRGSGYEIGLLDWLFAALALSTLVSVLGAPLILRTRLSPRDLYELLKPVLYYAYYRLARSAFSAEPAASGATSSARNPRSRLRRLRPVECPLLAVLLAAGTLSALFGICQYFDWLRVNEWLTPRYAPEHHLTVVQSAGRVVGTIGNPNYFGIFCVILLLTSLLSFWLHAGGGGRGAGSGSALSSDASSTAAGTGRRRLRGHAPMWLFALCPMPCALLGLVFSGSRTALLALAAAVAGVVLLALVRQLALLRLAIGVVVLASLLAGSIAVAEAFPHEQVDYLGRLTEGFNLSQDASFGLRLARWRSFLDAWLPHHAGAADIHATLTTIHGTGVAPASAEVRARDARRKADLLRLARAIDAYHEQRNRWPASGGLAGALVPAYLPALPLDPLTGQPYTEIETISGYSLMARLEDASDPDYPTYAIGSSPNYLLNGNLEQGSSQPDNWDTIPGTTISLERGDALYGAQAVLYHGDPSHPQRRAGIFQQRYFGRAGGQPFTASVWVKLPKPAAGQLELYANVIYTDGDRADPLTRVPVDMSRIGVWQKVNLSILPQSGKDVSFIGIYVISEGFSAEALIDGFQLVDGPVPLSFALTREAPVSDTLGFNPEAKLRHSPLIGVGPEKAAQGGSVDDEYLLYAARYGLIGIVLYLALYLGSLTLALRAFLLGDGGDSSARILPALVAATLIAFLLFNLTAGSFYELQLMAMFWLLAGAALAPRRNPPTSDTMQEQ